VGAPEQADGRRGASLPIVYVTVFVDLLGFSIILPFLHYFTQGLRADAVWVGVVLAAYSFGQFLGSPLLGRLSDRVGRRPVLLVSLVGAAVAMALTGLAHDLTTLVAARVLAGLFAGSISTAHAYVADVTRPEERARYMGLLGACIGLGFVVGPALGALLSHFGRGFSDAAFVAAGLAAANFLFAVFALRESRPAGARVARPARFDRAAIRSAAHRPNQLRLLVATFLGTIAFVTVETTYPLFAKRHFATDARDMGYLFTYLGLIMVAVQGGLVGRLARRVGERVMGLLGALVMGLAMLVVPLPETFALAHLPLAFVSLGRGLLGPAVPALLSRATGDAEQGSVLGLNQSVAALARAVGPLLAGWLYDTRDHLPYVVAGGAMLLTGWVLHGARVRRDSGGAHERGHEQVHEREHEGTQNRNVG